MQWRRLTRNDSLIASSTFAFFSVQYSVMEVFLKASALVRCQFAKTFATKLFFLGYIPEGWSHPFVNMVIHSRFCTGLVNPYSWAFLPDRVSISQRCLVLQVVPQDRSAQNLNQMCLVASSMEVLRETLKFLEHLRSCSVTMPLFLLQSSSSVSLWSVAVCWQHLKVSCLSCEDINHNTHTIVWLWSIASAMGHQITHLSMVSHHLIPCCFFPTVILTVFLGWRFI